MEVHKILFLRYNLFQLIHQGRFLGKCNVYSTQIKEGFEDLMDKRPESNKRDYGYAVEERKMRIAENNFENYDAPRHAVIKLTIPERIAHTARNVVDIVTGFGKRLIAGVAACAMVAGMSVSVAFAADNDTTNAAQTNLGIVSEADIQNTLGTDTSASPIAKTVDAKGDLPTSAALSASSSEDTSSSDSQSSEYVIQPGTSSKMVLTLQKRLMSLGYMEEDEPTEYYGSATKAAVKLFQRKHGLAEDGYVGEQTYKLLVSENAQKYSVGVDESGDDV